MRRGVWFLVCVPTLLVVLWSLCTFNPGGMRNAAAQEQSKPSIEALLKQVLERLDRIEKKLQIAEPIAENPDPLKKAEVEGWLPEWAQQVYTATKKMPDPERTYRQRQLRSMLNMPNGKRTRQQVIDGIPKGDPLYNFTSEEWRALNDTDEEWREEYGTDPALRPEEKPKETSAQSSKPCCQ